MLNQLVSKCRLGKCGKQQYETLYMTGISTHCIRLFLVLILGLLLFLTSKGNIWENKLVN